MWPDKYAFWKDVKSNFSDKIKEPLSHPPFIIYFITVIVFTGIIAVGLTIFIEVRDSHKPQELTHHISHIHIILSIAAYFIGLLTASAVDLILHSQQKKDDPRATILFGIGSLILGMGVMIFCLVTEKIPLLGYPAAILGTFLSWLVWWIANHDNHNLITNARNAIPSGNNLLGDLTPYNV